MRVDRVILAMVPLLFAVTVVEAKLKVVEASDKKPPTWINSSQSDYIIVTTIAPDIESARSECLRGVRDQILNAVAQNVVSNSKSNLEQHIENGAMTKMVDSFVESSKAKSANIPFLAGVSMNKVEGSYWEKRIESETKKSSFIYSIKYPFSKAELQSLVDEFRAQDQKMSDRYEELLRGFDGVSSEVDIDCAVTDVGQLVDYFFDDVRRNGAIALRDNYQAIYRSITIAEVSNELGEYRFQFLYNGRVISVASKPTVETNTLSQVRVEPFDGGWSVKYSYDTCDASEINDATIRCYVNGNRLVQRFYADVKSAKIDLRPTGTIYMKGSVGEDKMVSDIEIRISANCDLSQVVHIEQLTLNVASLGAPLIIEGLNIELSGSGVKNLLFNYSDKVPVARSQSGRKGILTGSINVLDGKGKRHTIKLSLPYSCNW